MSFKRVSVDEKADRLTDKVKALERITVKTNLSDN